MTSDDGRGRDRRAAALAYPDIELPYEYVALQHPDEYPMNEGRIVSSGGLDIENDAWEAYFTEQQEPHSTALHAVMKDRGAYLVGPMARYTLNHDRLTPIARDAAQAAGLGDRCANPFRSILVRLVEVILAFEEALRLIENYEEAEAPFLEADARRRRGGAATEAPRGLLVHRYEVDADGRLVSVRIVPPTSQNQKTIENDLRAVVERFIDLSDDDLQRRCEHAIRNSDPCISCATHFLKLSVDRTSGVAS